MYNLAAVCNAAGNVMAIMPHPERTSNGDVIFSSMKEFIENGSPAKEATLYFEQPHYEVTEYNTNGSCAEWIIDMIIADNEASSVQSALRRLGYDISIKRQTHWEMTIDGKKRQVLQKINDTGELYNSNKELISTIQRGKNTASFLVRQKEDMIGRSKFESLTRRFEINEISQLKRGVIWNVIVNSGNFETILNQVLDTHILFNPLSHECYRIN